MPGDGFSLTNEMVVQGLIGLLLFFWALKDALPAYRAHKKSSPDNPIVTAMSMSWDRDMQERLLQILERMAAAAELQAKQQISMSGSWQEMSDRQKVEMNERFENLLDALRRAEDRTVERVVSSRPKKSPDDRP